MSTRWVPPGLGSKPRISLSLWWFGSGRVALRTCTVWASRRCSNGVARIGQRRIEQGLLAMQQLVDALGQCGPLRLRQIEVAAQVEQGALFDLAGHALGLHQAMGAVRMSAVAAAGLGVSNEHPQMLHETGICGLLE